MTIVRNLGYGLTMLGAVPAGAAQLCVTCADPPALYRCELANETGAVNVPGFQLLCITDLAARGGHKSCSVDRIRAQAPCDAPLVTVTLPAGLPLPPLAAPASASPAAAEAVGATPPIPAPAPAPTRAPETVEALAKSAAEQSKKDWDQTQTTVKETTQAAGDGLKKAGHAVGTALEKSWTCVTSLFARC